MANRGKQFEPIIREAFERVPGVSIDRIPDQTMQYKGAANICDFIVYKEPYEYYVECKSVKGASLPFSNITTTQWNGMLQKSKISGVHAGIICWFIDKQVTLFIPIQALEHMKEQGYKSIRYDADPYNMILKPISGKRKRVFFEYDMTSFFEEVIL